MIFSIRNSTLCCVTGLAVGERDRGVSDSRIAVRFRRQQRGLHQRQFEAACHRDVTCVRQFKHPKGIRQRLLG